MGTSPSMALRASSNVLNNVDSLRARGSIEEQPPSRTVTLSKPMAAMPGPGFK